MVFLATPGDAAYFSIRGSGDHPQPVPRIAIGTDDTLAPWSKGNGMRHGWSIDGRDWVVLRQHLVQTNWREVTFTKSGVGTIPAEPGAYLIAAPPPLAGHPVLASLRTPLYVGHTNDLRRRMGQQLHGRRHITSTFSRVVFHFSQTSDVAIARQLEQSLILAFGPPDNLRHSIKMVAGQPVPAGGPRHNDRRTQ